MGDIFRHDITINNSKKLLLLDKKSNNYKSLGELARALFVKGYRNSNNALSLLGDSLPQQEFLYFTQVKKDTTNKVFGVKFSNGLIVNWGYESVGSNQSKTKTFAIPFTQSNTIAVSVNSTSQGNSYQYNAGATSFNTTSISLRQCNNASTMSFIAIGY